MSNLAGFGLTARLFSEHFCNLASQDLVGIIKAHEQAESMKIVTDIQQKPLDDAAAVQALRDSVNKPVAESTLDRLKRLTAA